MDIFLDSVGCCLNQSEIETFARQFRAAGHRMVSSPDQADLVVVNTCAVTAQAVSDSRQKIRSAGRAGAGQIVATGCWATLNPEQVSTLPSISHVFPNLSKDYMVADLLQVPPETFDLELIEREPLPGARSRTRAFIKVQDGCDNRCTFCVTTLARGHSRSRSIAEVLGDVNAAQRGGAQEVVLTGVHLGSWGGDFTPKQHLRQLIQAILVGTDIPRLRLSSLEPWDLDSGFFSLWEDRRLCRHLHLPLQSGCATTLRRMARKTTPQSFARLVEAARRAIPDVAITTDVIVGFPGEDSLEFADSLAFIKQMQFSGGHVFSYSARPGTAAAQMPGQVPIQEIKQRNAAVRSLLAESAVTYQKYFIGRQVEVLWESLTALDHEGWELSGLSDNYLRVSARTAEQLWNQLTPVRLTTLTSLGLQAHILGTSPARVG